MEDLDQDQDLNVIDIRFIRNEREYTAMPSSKYKFIFTLINEDKINIL